MGGHLCHASPLVADRRQGQARADAARQPLVERFAVRRCARSDERSDPLSRPHVLAALRLRRPRARAGERRGRRASPAAAPAERRGVLRGVHGHTRTRGDRRRNPAHARRNSGSGTFRRGLRPRELRPRCRGAILSRASVRRSGLRRFSRRVRRQVQPRALLLGQLRSRGDALFGTPGAGARRRRCDHARGLFARGEQRRLLARRRLRGCGVLLVHGTRAARLSRRSGRLPLGRSVNVTTTSS